MLLFLVAAVFTVGQSSTGQCEPFKMGACKFNKLQYAKIADQTGESECLEKCRQYVESSGPSCCQWDPARGTCEINFGKAKEMPSSSGPTMNMRTHKAAYCNVEGWVPPPSADGYKQVSSGVICAGEYYLKGAEQSTLDECGKYCDGRDCDTFCWSDESPQYDCLMYSSCASTSNMFSSRVSTQTYTCHQRSCPLGECCRITEEYGLVPGKTWGDTPKFEIDYWNSNNCDAVVGGSNLSNCPGTCSPQQSFNPDCFAEMQQFSVNCLTTCPEDFGSCGELKAEFEHGGCASTCVPCVYGEVAKLAGCKGETAMTAVTEAHSAGSGPAVHAFAAVGLVTTLYGAFRHYSK